jgi:hypothetical protein
MSDPDAKITKAQNVNKAPLKREDLIVELRGLEPLTFCMPCRRATNCAIAPRAAGDVSDGDDRTSAVGTQLSIWITLP